MSTDTLQEIIATAPKTPGVYTWRNAGGKAIYIGKAANLKSRLSSYRRTLGHSTTGEAADSRIMAMIEEAVSIDWVQLDTDIEALITESQLIKKYRPKFNIVMRDDKNYFYVVVTDEEFPKLIVTHQPGNADAIGPFTEGTPLKATLRVLRNLYPYCTCKQKHHLRCLNAHIGKCLGFCCLKTPATATQKRQYRRNIQSIRDLLSGKKLLKKLEQYAYIRRVFKNAQIVSHLVYPGEALRQALGLADIPHRIEGYDIANISGQHATGSMVVFTDGVSDKNEYRKFNIKTVTGSNDTAMLREVLTRRMTHDEWQLPDLILVDGGKGQLNAALSVVKNIPVISLTKDEHHKGHHILFGIKTFPLSGLPAAVTNLLLHIDGEAHRFAISHYRRRHSRSLTGV